jgi:hypothetical protein
MSPHPGSRTAFPADFKDDVASEDGILTDLKIKHAHVGEVGTVFEGKSKAVARMNGPCGQGDYKPLTVPRLGVGLSLCAFGYSDCCWSVGGLQFIWAQIHRTRH